MLTRCLYEYSIQNTKISHQIRKNGEIISEREWLLQNQNKEARAHMKDLLAQAVVHKGSFKPFLKSWIQNPRHGTITYSL